MKTVIALATVFLAFTVSSTTAFADDLIVSTNTAKNATQIVGLDLLSEGSAAGIEVRLNVNAQKGMSVDTSNCAKAMPKSHNWSCVYNGKEVVILGYSMKNESIPAGMLNLGSFSIEGKPSARSQKSAAPVVTSFIAAEAGGKQLDTKIHTTKE